MARQRFREFKSYVVYLAGFLILIVLIAGVFCHLDDQTPRYMCADPLPDSCEGLLMTVYGAIESENGVIQIPLYSKVETDALALVIGNSAPVTVVQDGQEILSSSSRDAYQRTQVIPLLPFHGESSIQISFSTSNPTNHPTRHILIGDVRSAQERVAQITMLNTFFLGLLSMVLVGSVILYLCKSTERYLIHLALGSLISLICLAVSYSAIFFLLSYRTTSALRAALLAVCPLEFLMILLRLYPGSRRKWLEYAVHVLAYAALFVALLILLGIAPSNFSYAYRLLVVPTAVFVLYDALRRGKGDAAFLLVSYAFMEGVCLASYFAARFLHYGLLFGFLRVIELGHLAYLVGATGVVFRRFAQHFSRAEALQKELTVLNVTLEERVAERTADLIEQQKRRQITMQNIFHDLRSPLQVLKTQVDAIPDADKNKKSLEQRLTYMIRLTEELFLVSNLESRNVIFDEDDVDLYEISKTAAQSILTPAKEKNVTVTCSGEQALIWGDSLRMEQAIQNLMDNALRHTSQGGTICISAYSDSENCFVCVHNTGSYIPPGEIDSIFERYYRSRMKHDPHSSGLGLSIAKEIVQAHQGSIRVESSPEHGTTFTMTIPKL